MAKTVKVSSDGGTTWYNLPGNTAEFSEDLSQTSDTLFGETFQSNEVSLLSWAVSANAVYKGYAGYLAKIKKSGSSTAMTGEAVTDLGGNIYQITNTLKQIIDRNTTFVVKDGTTDVSAQIEWIDYLYGKVKLVDTYTPTGTITVDGAYLPTSVVAAAKGYSLTQTAETIDTSDYNTTQLNGGYMTYNPGLRTVSLSLSNIFNATNDFSGLLNSRAELIIERSPSGDSAKSMCRGFFKATSRSQSGDVGALEEESLDFTLSVPYDNNLYSPFRWEYPSGTDLPEGLKIILQAWENETKPTLQYLHDGTSGYQGSVVVTDVSLEGAVDGINTFNASFQGDGAVTAV